MKRPRKGQTLELFNSKVPLFFGGKLLKGNAKKQRPLSTKHAVHTILKSEMARGSQSLLHSRHAKKIHTIIQRQARRFGINLYHQVNVGTHIHLSLKLPKLTLREARKAFHNFLRAITGLIASQVLGTKKGTAKNKRFWQARPYTRLVTFGRAFKTLTNYMTKNRNDALEVLMDWGFSIPYPDESDSLTGFS